MRAAGLDVNDNDTRHNCWINWWWNHTNVYHLRLSLLGIQFVNKQAKIQIYTINLAHPLLSTHLVNLTRIDIGPYYIHNTSKNNKILLLNEESATMLTLHAGNLGQYLENLQL